MPCRVSTQIKRRAGQRNVETTEGYIKLAEDLSGSLGAPFPPLPASLLGVLPPPPNEDGPATTREPAATVVPAECLPADASERPVNCVNGQNEKAPLSQARVYAIQVTENM